MRITKYSFLEKMQKIPCTIIMKTIEKFLFDWTKIIHKYIKAYYYPINISTIHKILKWIKTAFAPYIKDIYRLNKLGKSNGGSNISVD